MLRPPVRLADHVLAARLAGDRGGRLRRRTDQRNRSLTATLLRQLQQMAEVVASERSRRATLEIECGTALAERGYGLQSQPVTV